MGYIRDIMSKNVVTITGEKTVLDAARLLLEKDISFAVILRDNLPVGVVTERDIVRKVAAEDRIASEMTIDSICSSMMLSVEPTIPIEVAVQKMINSNMRRLVVLEEGRLAGVVTQTDLAGHLRSKLLINDTISMLGQTDPAD